MKYLDEYRDADLVRKWAQAIHGITTRPHTLMEVCGGQTHSIVKHGLDTLLPGQITLVHGPGCPVCVTPIELVDKAVAIASRPEVIFCSFGDMLRVPGTNQDLMSVKADGGDVRMVYSPLDALEMARRNPDREVVFFAVGFETTAPANAMAVHRAFRQKISNFSVLVSHVLVPPAMEAILSAPNNRVQGFLAAGHVCTVMGYQDYQAISARFNTPIVVTGFEPVDLLQGIHMCVLQLEENRAEVENQYTRSVQAEGNRHAIKMINEVFEIIPRAWRGLGEIAQSGLGLRPAFAQHDAEQKFNLDSISSRERTDCLSGQILQGHRKPPDCPAFGRECTPEHPLGATMVSSEGACAAYYRYRHELETRP